MLLAVLCILIAAWVLFMGAKFYRTMDWDEPALPRPDFGQMHKREAELLHVQDVLQEAKDQGKVSATLLEEYNSFLEKEIAEMKASEAAWKARDRQRPAGRRN